MSFKTPVLFLIFNRPDITGRVFNEIRKLQPAQLFIAADGPRANYPGEEENCTLTRQMVLNNIDWPCEVKTLFRDKNLGCGKAVWEAITWFFDHVEEGIILEDDCLPDNTFFCFCENLLERYRHNNEVMHIGGANFQNKNLNIKHSYYFSNYIHIWGWATWKRAWELYDFAIPHHFDQSFTGILKKKFPKTAEFDFWTKSFTAMAGQAIDTWDIQWSYSVYKNNGIGITPALNLISNIGFGPEATHTHSFDPNVTAIPLNSINEIKHPEVIKINTKADAYTFKKLFGRGTTGFDRIKFKIGKKIPLIKRVYLKTIGKKAQ
ncbi:nucleotide-diphospho-sugar transferase [Mucilaginibacter pocheonensis]|uniref:Nucleotide-diphospho-sugar transferase n=1 Tax=Mucilaginibacter pocheonensis TaxID=398050 RepID=A0ABU1T4V5_9SPHI|nr:nucleotide-diphospho-sugar transferase [Mucilaginibacter pocheonensis]MDR6940422.1 hypothetical protein [Mucilaginibacter pocheonensis]